MLGRAFFRKRQAFFTKFSIFQDLAIASYLVSLWEDEESKPKSFIDLGCGNGLLVYILTQEGFQGGVGLV